QNPHSMKSMVDDFPRKCRADPLNIAVSDRVSGEGMTMRTTWYDVAESPVYDPKLGGLMYISKTVSTEAYLYTPASSYRHCYMTMPHEHRLQSRGQPHTHSVSVNTEASGNLSGYGESVSSP